MPRQEQKWFEISASEAFFPSELNLYLHKCKTHPILDLSIRHPGVLQLGLSIRLSRADWPLLESESYAAPK